MQPLLSRPVLGGAGVRVLGGILCARESFHQARWFLAVVCVVFVFVLVLVSVCEYNLGVACRRESACFYTILCMHVCVFPT